MRQIQVLLQTLLLIIISENKYFALLICSSWRPRQRENVVCEDGRTIKKCGPARTAGSGWTAGSNAVNR